MGELVTESAGVPGGQFRPNKIIQAKHLAEILNGSGRPGQSIGGVDGSLPRQSVIYFTFAEAVEGVVGAWTAKRIDLPVKPPEDTRTLKVEDLGEQSPDTDLIVWSLDEIELGIRCHQTGKPAAGVLVGFMTNPEIPILQVLTPPAPRTFPARIRKSGGTAGDDGVRATFTYDLYSLAGGDSFAQSVAVALSERKIPAEMTAAPDDSYADVLIVSPGSYLITRCDEVYVTKQCDNSQSDEFGGGEGI